MPTTRGNLFGFDKAFVWRVDSDGIATGQLDPDNPGSTPLTSHAYEIGGPMTLEMPGANFGSFDFRGGGAFEGKADAGLESIDTGTMQSSQCDAALAVMLAGGLLDTTTITGGPTIWSTNDLNPSPHQVGLMLVRKIQSRVVATAGLNYYATVIFPLVQMRMTQANFTQEPGTNTAAVTLTIEPQVGSRFPWGEAFGSNQQWYNNQNIWFGINSDNPWALTAFIADGTETSYTLAYLPSSATVTSGRGDHIYAIDGVPTAPDNVSTSTAVVTLAGAGTDGDRHVAFYQTNNYATP